jgi:hypothetical protein
MGHGAASTRHSGVDHSHDAAPAGKAYEMHEASNSTLDHLERIMSEDYNPNTLPTAPSPITASLARTARALQERPPPLGGSSGGGAAGGGAGPAEDVSMMSGGLTPYALADIDFTIPDGDFPADIASLLPPSPGPAGVGGAGHDHHGHDDEVSEMDLSAIDIDPSDGIELLGGGAPSPITNSLLSELNSPSLALGGGSAASPIFGTGANPLTLANMFPQSGVSPLQQYQLLDAAHARRTAAATAAAGADARGGGGGAARFHAPMTAAAGRGGDWRFPSGASSTSDSAIVRRYAGVCRAPPPRVSCKR